MKMSLMIFGLFVLSSQVYAGLTPSKVAEKFMEEEKKVAEVGANSSEGEGSGASPKVASETTDNEFVVIRINSPKWMVTADGATVEPPSVAQTISVVEGLQEVAKESLAAPSQCEEEKRIKTCKAQLESIHDELARIDDALGPQELGNRHLSDVQLHEETKMNRTTGCQRWLARCQATLKRGAKFLFDKCCPSTPVTGGP